MSDEKDVRRWVSSKLHDLLGFSESTVAQFVLSVARKHTSADSLAAVLKQQGLPAGAETTSFAAELLARLPSPAGASRSQPSAAQLEARQAKQFLKKNAAYELLDEPAPPAALAPAPAPSVTPAQESAGSKKEHKRERKLRDKAKSRRQEEEEDAGLLKQHKKQKVGWRALAIKARHCSKHTSHV